VLVSSSTAKLNNSILNKIRHLLIFIDRSVTELETLIHFLWLTAPTEQIHVIDWLIEYSWFVKWMQCCSFERTWLLLCELDDDDDTQMTYETCNNDMDRYGTDGAAHVWTNRTHEQYSHVNTMHCSVALYDSANCSWQKSNMSRFVWTFAYFLPELSTLVCVKPCHVVPHSAMC